MNVKQIAVIDDVRKNIYAIYIYNRFSFYLFIFEIIIDVKNNALYFQVCEQI